MRINGMNFSLWIVPKRFAVICIWEVTCQWDTQADNFSNRIWRTVHALKTPISPRVLFCFCICYANWFLSTRNISCGYNHVVSAEFAFRLWMNQLHIFERSTSNCNARSSCCRATIWLYWINADIQWVTWPTWLIHFKQFIPSFKLISVWERQQHKRIIV